MKNYPGRWLVAVVVLLWAVSVLYVIACLLAPTVIGEAGCELAPGTSIYGSASRSWLPPGTTCTYNLTDAQVPAENYVVAPSTERLLLVAVAIMGLPLAYHLHRVLSRAGSVKS